MAEAAKKLQSFVKENAQEADWWYSLKAGDRSALSGIYNAYVESMFAYGMSIAANRDLVKDCVQDVFVDVWKYRANLAPTDNIKFYLLKSLRNKIFQVSAREKKSLIKHSEFQEVILTPSHEEELVLDQQNKVIQAKLANSVEKLPERQKEVIRHLFFENLSYEETSIIMAINLRSVYTLAWKALSSMRKSLPEIYSLLLLSFCAF